MYARMYICIMKAVSCVVYQLWITAPQDPLANPTDASK